MAAGLLMAEAAIEVLDNQATREAMRKRVFSMHVPWAGTRWQSYMQTLVRASAGRRQSARAAFPVQTAEKNATSRLIKPE